MSKTPFEYLIFSGLICISMALCFARYAEKQNRFKHQQKMIEETLLRQGVRWVQHTQGVLPHNLDAVLEALRSFGLEEPLRINPFGEGYQYDAKTGWVE